MIEARGLTRRFGDLLAVDSLDLDVQRGEVLGFLGPNGAGKTTTVRMLCALIAPSSGEARVNGFDVRTRPQDVRRSVGILTESPGMYERLTARHNLDVFAQLYGVPDRAARVERYLRRLELWDRRDDAVATLSKGTRQRLAICRALLHEPPVVFLDEPTSGLDPEAARKVRDVVLELRAEGRTVFLCTHNLDEADRLCDRVALFRGRILELDTPQRLRERVYGRRVVVTLREVTEAHVAAVRALGEVEVDGQQLRAQVGDPAQATPGLVRALVAAGADVLRVEEEQVSLEELYLRLIGESP